MSATAPPTADGAHPPDARRLTARSLAAGTVLHALTIAFGLQVIRVLVPELTWVLGDRFSLSAFHLGGAALIVFSAAFLAGLVRRMLGIRWSTLATAGGLGLARLLLQFWWGEPVVNLGLAMLGTALFTLYLPLALGQARGRGTQAVGALALGVPAALMLDTALHSAFLSYDSAWQPAPGTLLLTAALVAVQWALLRGRSRSAGREADGEGARSRAQAAAWLGIGPFLFLQLVVFQNVARLAVLTGWRLPLAALWVLLADVAALAAVALLLARSRRNAWPVAVGSAVVLATVSAIGQATGWAAAAVVMGGHVAASILLGLMMAGRRDSDRPAGVALPTASSGGGMVLLVVLILAYYVVYQIALPYNNTVLETFAAGILALCGIAAAVGRVRLAAVVRRAWLAPAVATLLAVPVIVSAVTWHEAEPASGDGFPVRVMTYNLHNGFNPDGRLDVEALASVIEEEKPDIVVLQEVSRGWLISGRLDMLTWLSQRLEMPHVSGPTADPFWGNAILSRFPILSHESHDLPPRDLFLLRGFTWATVDIGRGETLQVMAIHLHHLEPDSAIRVPQSRALVEFWDGLQSTVILGDFNAEADAPEIALLRDAGLVDAAASATQPPADTFKSTDLTQRIDYIWASADLTVTEVHTSAATASDHLPVTAVVDR